MKNIFEKKKTIIFLGQMPPPYIGPNIATQIILNSKMKKDFRLVHLDSSDHRDLGRLGRIDFQNIGLAFRDYYELIRLIIKESPSMVYIPISQTTLGYLRDSIFILISILFRKRVLCHLRGGNFKNWYLSSRALTKCFVRRVHSLVDGQIVLGEKMKDQFEGILPKEKIFVVPNGKRIGLKYKKEKDTDKARILFLSNFIREKGIIDFLACIPYVYGSKKSMEFVLVGDWFDRDTKTEIESYIKKNVEFPIRIKGPLLNQEKYNMLASCDIFVFPTYYPAEGHPWVIIEAMAQGLPIVTTDQGAIAESVIDGVNGFIVEKRNPVQIAEKIKFLIENPDIRKKMGEESRRLYLENFTEEKMIERLSYAFNSVLSS